MHDKGPRTAAVPFCGADGADGYQDRFVSEMDASARGSLSRFEVPGHDDVVALRGESNGLIAVAINATPGPFNLQVVTNGDAAVVTLDEATERAVALLESQLAAL